MIMTGYITVNDEHMHRGRPCGSNASPHLTLVIQSKLMESLIICTYLCLIRPSRADLQDQSEHSILFFLQGCLDYPDLESLSSLSVIKFWESSLWVFLLKKRKEGRRHI